MTKEKDRNNDVALTIDEEGIIAGDIEAIRKVYHERKQVGISFDMAPYCG